MINGTPLDRIMTGGFVGNDKSQTLSDSVQADIPDRKNNKRKKTCPPSPSQPAVHELSSPSNEAIHKSAFPGLSPKLRVSLLSRREASESLLITLKLWACVRQRTAEPRRGLPKWP